MEKKNTDYLGCAGCGKTVETPIDENYHKELPPNWTRKSLGCFCEKCSKQEAKKTIREILEKFSYILISSVSMSEAKRYKIQTIDQAESEIKALMDEEVNKEARRCHDEHCGMSI